MKRRKRKSILTALALVILSGIASVGATFAWWNVLEISRNDTLDVGSRVKIAIINNTAGAGNLVPFTEPNLIGNQVKEIEFDYSINITDADGYLAQDTYRFHVNIIDVLLDGDVAYTDDFQFEVKHNVGAYAIGKSFDYDPAVGQHDVSVKVTWQVEKDDLTEVELDLLQNTELSFTTVFSLEK